ncbi:MAG: GNAT family N-acetyltransferase [Patescibacteria group bacterium]
MAIDGIDKEAIVEHGMRYSISREGQEVARGYLFILRDDLKEPFGLVNDIFVHEKFREEKDLKKQIVQAALADARRHGCHTIITVCGYTDEAAHDLYSEFSFSQTGDVFRLDFKPKHGRKGS